MIEACHTYVRRDAWQAEVSTEIPPTGAIAVGCASEQTTSKGLPSRQANSEGGVQE